LIVSKDVIQVEANPPILSRNKLGWVVHGPAEFPNNMKKAIVNLCCERGDEELHQLVKDQMSLENFGMNIIIRNFISNVGKILSFFIN
jgi:hypothetical protein